MTASLTLNVKPEDVLNAACGNRRQCVLAHAVNRQMGLGGQGYIKVDATGLAFTIDGQRHRFAMNLRAKQFLAEFDQVGETQGTEVARTVSLSRLGTSRNFTFKRIDITPVTRVCTPAQRTKINERRVARDAAKRAQGEKVHRSSARYVGA